MEYNNYMLNQSLTRTAYIFEMLFTYKTCHITTHHITINNVAGLINRNTQVTQKII